MESEDLKRMKELRAQIVDKWEKSGLLDGLKGHVKPEIAKLYECCSTAKLDDSILPLSIKIITELKPDQEIVGTIKRVKNNKCSCGRVARQRAANPPTLVRTQSPLHIGA